MNPLFNEIAFKIIKEQELVIGPLAWSEAGKVQGLQVDGLKKQVSFSNDDVGPIIDKLVAQYERLFGRASQEVCREAVASIVSSMPAAQVPSSLR